MASPSVPARWFTFEMPVLFEVADEQLVSYCRVWCFSSLHAAA